jgi:adenylate cyclase
VVGKHKYIYDLYGEAPTMANAMESTGNPGKIQVSQETYELLHNEYILEERNQPMDFKVFYFYFYCYYL